jgi:WD40-like Beta Propeller Repeat
MNRILFALAVLALLALPGTAGADSLVFTRDHNVWLANPDGSGQYQVTSDGNEIRPYLSPSQADDGTIVAGHGSEIVRLRQNGEVISSFDPPAATDSVGAPIDEVPQEISVSPDGSRIAFVYYRSSCPPAAPCGTRQVLLYSYADHATPVSTFGQQSNRRNPSWVDGNRILLFGGAGSQVNLDSPGGGNDDAVHWFDDEEMEDLDDGELSRQGDRLALLRSYGSNLHLAIFHVDGVGGGVQAACFSGTDAKLGSPTWSPDGRSLAFADSEGIEVLPLPSVVAGDCPGAGSGRVVVPGAAEPDWGPADVAPGPRPCSGCGGEGGAARVALKRSKTAKLGAALKHGIVIVVTVSGAGRVKAVAKLGGKQVAAGAATAKAAGTVKVRLRFVAKAAKKLRRRAKLKLATKVAFSPAGGGKAVTAQGSLRLER